MGRTKRNVAKGKIESQFPEQQHRYFCFYSEMPRKQQSQLVMKREGNKVNDRLQDKLNMLNRHDNRAIRKNNESNDT